MAAGQVMAREVKKCGIAVTLHDLGGVRVHGQAQTGQGTFSSSSGERKA